MIPMPGGVVSAGGVGFDISCGVRTMPAGVTARELAPVQKVLADQLYRDIPAGVGSEGAISLDPIEMDHMLAGGAAWAVERGFGEAADLARLEEGGTMAGACPDCVSSKAKHRQHREMGTLGSGNHYLEVQVVAEIFDAAAAAAFGLATDDVLVTIHCGSRGLGHQIGSEYLKEMAVSAAELGIDLPDRDLACAPIRSELGERYLGAMRAAINCAPANREILGHFACQTVRRFFPQAPLSLLFDVSHNTCKEEIHEIDGRSRGVHVHRKGATRALGPGHPSLPVSLRSIGQPVLIGGSMGTASYVLAGTATSEEKAFSSACHGAGRAMSRHAALNRWSGRKIVDDLALEGILIRSPSSRGVAEEARPNGRALLAAWPGSGRSSVSRGEAVRRPRRARPRRNACPARRVFDRPQGPAVTPAYRNLGIRITSRGRRVGEVL